MSVWRFWLNITCILFINEAIHFIEINAAVSGPYKSSIRSAKACDAPSREYMKNPPMMFEPAVHNVSNTFYLSGNVTVLQDTKNVKYRMKSFIWEDDNWRLNNLMNSINCHGILLHLICAAVSVKYDRKNCMFLKGQYIFTNLDINAVQHYWATSMEYGKIMWRAEIFNPKLGTFFCHDFEMITEPV